MKISKIIPIALQSFRVNPFHTFLSCLGIIIGVGALFSILSLADGMEQMARDRIAARANLKAFSVATKTTERIDGLWIRKDSFDVITPPLALVLEDSLRDSKIQLRNVVNAYLTKPNDTLRTGGAILGLFRIQDEAFGNYEFVAGQNFTQSDIDQALPKIVITKTIADNLFPLLGTNNVLGKEIEYKSRRLTIVGILDTQEKLSLDQSPMLAAIPITLYNAAELRKHIPGLSVDVQTIESYDSEKAAIERFLDHNFKSGKDGFIISSYDGVMKEVQQGMLLFKIIMGMIVGISVVVGGIGIMNVLLMSIKERTKEIGVRKAIGASASSIKWQFLTEALFLSFIGSALGVVLGIAFLTLAMAVLQQFPDMPFTWAFSWGTTLVIVVVAILIGLLFGVYPAAKAAKLDPIEAIRHE